jgi:hypothetical protein
VDAALVFINFTETVKIPLSLSLSFSLPVNATDTGVIAALQKEVASAAYDVIKSAAAGATPLNLTVVPTISTNVDGSSTVTMTVLATLAASINTTATAVASLYSADPIGVAASAIKAASNGASVALAAAELTRAAKRAADAFTNGTILSGTPPLTLASRLAAAASAALVAAGKSTAAALLNSTNMAPAVAVSIGPLSVDISNQTFGAPGSSADSISASDASSALPNIIHNGLYSGAAFALTTLVAVYLYLGRSKLAAALPAPHPADKLNPLYQHTAKRPRPPPGKAPKHAYRAFGH